MMIFTLPLNGRVTLRAGLRSLMLLGIAAALHLWPASVSAQAPGTGFASAYSANAGKPVDIQADVLEVDDKKKTAVFRGNVSATQGDVNLKSKELYVTYTPKDKTANAVSSDAAASPLGGGNEITQIDAKGNVYVVTKPSNGQLPQNAKSDWAIFDVKKQQVTLGGDVILSQGENVIRGSKLVIDLTSGLSRFENPGSAGGQGGRMQAIFTPPPKDKDKDKNKEAKDKESKDGKTSAQ
jgi:lipopolysaccharide export system protein LptA